MANLSNNSSGFISAPSTESEEEQDGTGSTDESSVVTIGSFRSFIENHTRPFTRDYDLFATSYLCDDVPFDHILCDDSDSVQDIQVKFVEAVPIQKYFIQQKCRQEFGPSVRKKFIIPSVHLIWKEIETSQKEIVDGGERTQFLYEKAKQWCEINKALAMDHKYPKPDSNVVRQKYSTAHQRAVKLVRKESGLGGKREPIFHVDPVKPFSKWMALYFLRGPKNDWEYKEEPMDIFVGYDVGTELNDEEKGKWNAWKETLHSVFAEITPLAQLQKREKHWQTRALERKTSRPCLDVQKTIKKRFWKRNTYPPMTMENRIAAKRKLLPPHKPEGLAVDYLSGIWEPELMTDEFVITPLNYDSRLEEETDRGRPDPISWWESHRATQKCWKWLKNIPDDL